MGRGQQRAPVSQSATPQVQAPAAPVAAAGAPGGDNAFVASQLGLAAGQAAGGGGDAGDAATPVSSVIDVQGQGEAMSMDYITAHGADTVRQVSVADDANAAGTEALRGHNPSQRGTGLGEGHSAPRPADPLPYREGGGWDAPQILAHAGQFDLLEGTDSDGDRCVQAVALAARILDGPDAVVGYVDATIRTAPARPTPRQAAAVTVLQRVRARLAARTATYAELSWIQEAAHDMIIVNENQGTAVDDIVAEVARGGDAAVTPMNAWADTADEAVALASGLRPGEKLIVTTWEVIFNSHLDTHDVRAGQVGTDHRGQHAHRIRRLRIQEGVKPHHDQIDELRDSVHGHQMLLYTNGGTPQLYDPEVSGTGLHTRGVTGQDLARYFHDNPDDSTYRYVQVMGRMSGPQPAAGAEQGAAPTS